MAFLPLLPSRARVGVLGFRQNVALLKSSFFLEERPAVEALHTREELRAINQDALRQRALILEDARAQAAQRDTRSTPRTLTLVDRVEETAKAVSLVFQAADDTPVAFTPGQYMTLLFEVDGVELRRSYSFSSHPSDPTRFSVTVKRVEGGVISNLINDSLHPGQEIRAQGPNGRFGTAPRDGERRRLILVGGGSGITPLMSIALAITEGEPFSQVELYYGNRRAEEVIFKDRLAALAKRRSNFKVRHVLGEDDGTLPCRVGRLAGDVLEEELPIDAKAEYYICGPGAMMDGVIDFLKAKGIPDTQIQAERFASPKAPSKAGSTGATWSMQLAKSGALIQVGDDQTLLEGGLAGGLAMSFSCAMGGCAACKVRVIEGEVEMDEPNCLTPEERARGEVLACVAKPRSPIILDL